MANDILIIPGSASMHFSGSQDSSIKLKVAESGSLVFSGNSGSLFSIEDALSGSLFSVNDVSGLPIMEILSDGAVTFSPQNYQLKKFGFGCEGSSAEGTLDIVNTVDNENVTLYLRTTDDAGAESILYMRGARNTSIVDPICEIQFETGDTGTPEQMGEILLIKDIANTNVSRMEFGVTDSASGDGGTPVTQLTLSGSGDSTFWGGVTASNGFYGDGTQLTFGWSTSTQDGTASVNTAYFISGSDITGSLPPTSVKGDFLRFVNTPGSNLRISQGPSQQILYSTGSTTVGITGYVEALNDGDSFELICYTDNTTWIIVSSVLAPGTGPTLV